MSQLRLGIPYYAFRYYDAEAGRWLTRDPIEEWGAVNIYAFIDNDPQNYFDILGERKGYSGGKKYQDKNPKNVPRGITPPKVPTPPPPKPPPPERPGAPPSNAPAAAAGLPAEAAREDDRISYAIALNRGRQQCEDQSPYDFSSAVLRCRCCIVVVLGYYAPTGEAIYMDSFGSVYNLSCDDALDAYDQEDHLYPLYGGPSKVTLLLANFLNLDPPEPPEQFDDEVPYDW